MRVIFMRRRWACTLLCVLSVLIIIIAYLLVHRWDACSDHDSQIVLQHVCEAYNNGHITGELCSSICGGDHLYSECTNYREGKVVLFFKQDDKLIVVKSKKPLWTDFDQLFLPVHAGQEAPRIKDFVSIVKDMLWFNQRIRYAGGDDALLDMLYPNGADQLKTSQESIKFAVMRSLWSLIQQDEYVYMRYLQPSPHIPRVLSTCGHMYTAELLPTPLILKPSLTNVIAPVETSEYELAKAAQQVLTLLQYFQHHYAEPLHICDLKGDNLGTDDSGVYRLIDLDMLRTDSHMRHELANVTCTKHDDCNFFDCYGVCDVKGGVCTDKRRNNNLQVACTKLFLGAAMSGHRGLLPVTVFHDNVDLSELLSTCIYPPHVDPALHIAPLPYYGPGPVNEGEGEAQWISTYDETLLKDLYETLNRYTQFVY